MSTTTTPSYPKRTGDSRTDFLALFPLIVDELVTYMKSEGMPEDAIKWYTEVSQPKATCGELNTLRLSWKGRNRS